MISAWRWYDVGTMCARFCNDFVWFGYDRRWCDFAEFGYDMVMVLAGCWFGFGIVVVLISPCFWHDIGMALA